MVLVLYNSLGRRLTKFKPLSGKRVKMYTCGPTVYNYAHIGNFRTFVFEDVLRRYLKHKGYSVLQVKNITDVEDRIIEGIKRTGMSLQELTDFFTKAFMEDLDTLNIQRAEQYPRATEFIDEMVKAVESLMKKGYAYRAEDGSIYFSIKKFPRYGRLSGIKQAEVKSGTRVAADHYEKMGANDFALWKAWDPDDGSVFWETSLGKGRPGWHIECSVMAMKYLGASFDIHTGGKDLKFPHHENEIAQSEALTGKRFVKVWLHSEFLNINGEKMSKSLGNFITLRDLVKQAWSPRAIRLFLISAHYRDELNLTDNSMGQAEATMKKIDQFYERLLQGQVSAAKGKASRRGPARQVAAPELRPGHGRRPEHAEGAGRALRVPAQGQCADRLQATLTRRLQAHHRLIGEGRRCPGNNAARPEGPPRPSKSLSRRGELGHPGPGGRARGSQKAEGLREGRCHPRTAEGERGRGPRHARRPRLAHLVNAILTDAQVGSIPVH